MKVSVLIPVYNKAHCLARCLHSIVNQTYKDLEILVYDDGSTDNSVDVAHRIKDNRIRIIEEKHNAGISHARNVLMRAAKGPMSTWQDADDYSNPWRIEIQMAASKACGVVTSRVFRRNTSRVSGEIDIHPAPNPVGVLTRRGTFASEMFPSRPVIPFHLGLQLNHELLWGRELGYKYGHHVVVRAVYYYYNDEKQPFRTADATNVENAVMYYWHKRALWGKTLRYFCAKLAAQGYLSCPEPPSLRPEDLPVYKGSIVFDTTQVTNFRNLLAENRWKPTPLAYPEEVSCTSCS